MGEILATHIPPAGGQPTGVTAGSRPPVWVHVVLVLSLVKIMVALLGVLAGLSLPGGYPIPAITFVLIAGVFGGTGLVLIQAGRRDAAAQWLGMNFVLTATAYADPLLRGMAAASAEMHVPFQLLRRLQLDALSPWFLWSFVIVFPKATTFGWVRRFPVLMRNACLPLAVFLVMANLALLFAERGWVRLPAQSLLVVFDRGEVGSAYHPLLITLGLGALAFAAWKARFARVEERRRVRLLLAGLLLGVLPTAIVSLLYFTWPTFRSVLATPEGLIVAGVIAYPALLSIPIVTGYAVLVRHALDVRLVVRQAVRYALARWTVLALAFLPAGGIAVLLWRNRDQTLFQILSGRDGVILLAVGAAALAALKLRHHALDAIDRLFFRERYDARRILGGIASVARDAVTVEQLEELTLIEIDRALHVSRLAFLHVGSDGTVLVSARPEVRPLRRATALVALLASRHVLDIDWEHVSNEIHSLPPHDQDWLAEGGYRVLVPIRASAGDAIGLLCLGDKRSELPFTREDRALLVDAGRSVAASLERMLDRDSSTAMPTTTGVGSRSQQEGADRPQREDAATECLSCGVVHDGANRHCRRCGAQLVAASVPVVLGGKYRIVRRIGRGGMGVVYRGTDITLGRPVAVKALPRVSPRRSQLMRREARAMAAVSHPNLALIFAVELWNGTPCLVVEYLPGGTLADKLRRGPLPVREAVRLAMVLASVATRIHRAGILHRDIKPANVGFTSDGTPKLLDFGLAGIFDAAAVRRMAPVPAGTLDSTVPGLPTLDLIEVQTTSRAPPGTIAYMSPEALRGETPEPSFDLWSINIVLYESVAGCNPVVGEGMYMAMSRILDADFPDIREFRPDTPPALAHHLHNALSAQRSRRPPTADDLLNRLGRLDTLT